MKLKVTILIIFSVAILGLLDYSQDAHADSITFTVDTTILSDQTIDTGEVWTINPGVTLTIDPGVTVTINSGGDLIIIAGTLTNFGTVNINTGQLFNIAGSTINNNGPSLIVSQINGLIINDGSSINNNAGASIQLGLSTFLSNQGEASFVNNLGGTVTIAGFIINQDTGSSILNGGIITGSGIIWSTGAGVSFINTGTIIRNSDSFIVNDATSNFINSAEGNIQVNEGANIFNIGGGTFTNNLGGMINLSTNGNLFNQAASTLNNAGTISSRGTLVNFGVGTNIINTGSLTSNSGGAILNDQGATITNNPAGIITNDVGSVMGNGFNSMIENNSGGGFNNNGQYFSISSSTTNNNSGGIINNGGIFFVDVANTLNNNAGSFFNNDPGSIFSSSGTLNNGGTLINDATSVVANTGGGTMTNLSGGVMLNRLNGFAFNGAGSTINNNADAIISNSFGVWHNECNGTVINNGVLLGTIQDLPCGPLSDPVIMAAGDIACEPEHPAFNNGQGTANECRQLHTSDIIVSADPDAVLLLGDNQYFFGELSAHLQSYDPSWGRVKSITKPSPGNHEYLTPSAVGYYDYFGTTAGDRTMGYYSFNLGSWHLISLNSNCVDIGGCGPGSPQAIWLENDLLSNPVDCTLAYWHHPRFSSGTHGSDITYDEFWKILHQNNADVVLVGHDHNYERFATQDSDANPDAQGIRQFVVGTGGKDLRPINLVAANSELFESGTFGVLELTLHQSSYDWEFIAEVGEVFTDSGTANCN